MIKRTKVIAVVGPTASGKTALAIQLAKHLGGEVVSADSMQIYQGMQIATAKPTQEEMQGVPHHLMGFLAPSEAFSVSDYVVHARNVIDQIYLRGKLPIVVGGTGLYIDALLQNIVFCKQEYNDVLRQELYRCAEVDGGASLYQELCRIDPIAAADIHPHNLVRIVRGVEIYRLTGKTLTHHKQESRQHPSPYQSLWIGLTFHDRQKLYQQVEQRVDRMMEQGLVEEACGVLAGKNLKTAFNAIGYKELMPYFQGQATIEQCVEHIKQATRRYAKRQLTWFRRNQAIQWKYQDDGEGFEDIWDICRDFVEE